MNKLLKSAAAVVVVLVLVIAAFGMGVYYDRTAERPDGDEAAATDVDIADAVTEVADIISAKALAPTSETSMTAGAIQGMLESLEDSHAVYFDPQHFEYFNEQNMGTFYGIGVTISNDGDDLVINSVIAGPVSSRTT